MRWFVSSLLGIITIAIIAVLVIGFIMWSRVPDIIANNLSQRLKVSVEIDDIGISLRTISIDNLEIGNVPRGILQKAFSSKLITFHAPLTQYLNNQIVIDEIDLKDVYLGLEFDSATSTNGNWTIIMNNLQNSSSSTRSSEKSKKASDGKSVFIKKLVLTNISVDVVYRKDGGKIQKLPIIKRIELSNISSSEGLPMDQIMNSVLGQMLKSVFEKENLKNMLNELLQNAPGNIDKYLGPFKGIFNARPSVKDPLETSTNHAA